jgi:ADP-ribose pyrophosphatase
MGWKMMIEKNDKIIYEGHFTLVKRKYNGKYFDIVISKDAAIMLYIDENDLVYFTKQFRPALQREVLELPAETLDKPELTPLEVMIEGLEEECGLRIKKNQVKDLGELISTDGHDTEKVHLFLAHGKGEYVGQRLEDTEKIEIVKIPFDKAYEMVLKNEIQGAKSSYLITYEKLRRLGEVK